MKHLCKLLICVALSCLAGSAFAGKAKPDAMGSRIDWSYPAVTTGCLLDLANKPSSPNSITRGGVLIPIGQQAETKHGVWLCVRAIVRQDDATTGGVWVPAPH